VSIVGAPLHPKKPAKKNGFYARGEKGGFFFWLFFFLWGGGGRRGSGSKVNAVKARFKVRPFMV